MIFKLMNKKIIFEIHNKNDLNCTDNLSIKMDHVFSSLTFIFNIEFLYFVLMSKK